MAVLYSNIEKVLSLPHVEVGREFPEPRNVWGIGSNWDFNPGTSFKV